MYRRWMRLCKLSLHLDANIRLTRRLKCKLRTFAGVYRVRSVRAHALNYLHIMYTARTLQYVVRDTR